MEFEDLTVITGSFEKCFHCFWISKIDVLICINYKGVYYWLGDTAYFDLIPVSKWILVLKTVNSMLHEHIVEFMLLIIKNRLYASWYASLVCWKSCACVYTLCLPLPLRKSVEEGSWWLSVYWNWFIRTCWLLLCCFGNVLMWETKVWFAVYSMATFWNSSVKQPDLSVSVVNEV